MKFKDHLNKNSINFSEVHLKDLNIKTGNKLDQDNMNAITTKNRWVKSGLFLKTNDLIRMITATGLALATMSLNLV